MRSTHWILQNTGTFCNCLWPLLFLWRPNMFSAGLFLDSICYHPDNQERRCGKFLRRFTGCFVKNCSYHCPLAQGKCWILQKKARPCLQGHRILLGPPTVDPTALEAYIQICPFKGSEISGFVVVVAVFLSRPWLFHNWLAFNESYVNIIIRYSSCYSFLSPLLPKS